METDILKRFLKIKPPYKKIKTDDFLLGNYSNIDIILEKISKYLPIRNTKKIIKAKCLLLFF